MSLINLELEPESYLEPDPEAKRNRTQALQHCSARPWSQTKSDRLRNTARRFCCYTVHAFPHK